jgi:hypothetical protein
MQRRRFAVREWKVGVRRRGRTGNLLVPARRSPRAAVQRLWRCRPRMSRRCRSAHRDAAVQKLRIGGSDARGTVDYAASEG